MSGLSFTDVMFGSSSNGREALAGRECFPRASWVRHPNVPEAFIVGPYPDSAEKYWCGITKAEADIGVQLEQEFGENYHQCPGREDVRLVDTSQVAAGVVRRVYTLGSDERLFTHYAVAWPDFGVPEVSAFSAMLEAYDKDVHKVLCASGTGVTTHVHCWAGMGRSGTFLLARVLSMMPDEETQNSDVVLASLRAQRPGLVERQKQKEFAQMFRGCAKSSVRSTEASTSSLESE